MIWLTVGLVFGAIAGTIFGRVSKQKEFDRKKTRKTEETPYRLRRYKLTQLNNLNWNPKMLRDHLRDLAQSMESLDDLSLVQVDLYWKASKAQNHSQGERFMCNLKTMIAMTEKWQSTGCHIVDVSVHLVEVQEPILDRPHPVTEEEMKIIKELRESDVESLRRRREAQTQRAM